MDISESLDKIFPTYQQRYLHKNNSPRHQDLDIGRQKTKPLWEAKDFNYMETTGKLLYKSLNSYNVRGEIWRRSVRSFTVTSYLLAFIVNRRQRLIWSPAKRLWCGFFVKTVIGQKLLTFFIKKLPHRYFTESSNTSLIWLIFSIELFEFLYWIAHI